MQIAPLLNIGRGVTALIGGGGKTTLLYTLTEELRKKGTVLLCILHLYNFRYHLWNH